jgi:DNA-binding NarL/FixJ family response regulator
MAPTAPITTVVLARFEDLLATGLLALLDTDPSLTVLASDVEHARLSVVLRAHAPDVAILDLGALSKLAEVRALVAAHPTTRLVLLAQDPSPVECMQVLAFGASACIGRDTQSRDVLNTIHQASRGMQVSPRVSQQSRGEISGGQLLTPREADVLPLLQAGSSNSQIALALQVGVETVRTHARNIYRKLGVASRRELIAPPGPAPVPQPATSGLSHRAPSRAPGRARRGHGLRSR